MTLSKLIRLTSLSICVGIFAFSLTSCINNVKTKSKVTTSSQNSSSSITGNNTITSSELHPAFTAANGNYGYINDSGKFVISQQFIQAGDFKSDGYAVVTANNNKQGVIDKSGNYIIEPAYDFVDFENGTSVFENNNNNGGYDGIVDISGKIIVDPKYQQLNNYSEGIAVAHNFTNSKAGYEITTSYAFDTTGKLIFTCSGSLGNFHDGFATLQEDKSQLYGYVNKNGTIVIKPQYRSGEDFKDEKAEISTYGNNYFDIDKTGKILDSKSSDDLNDDYQKFDDGLYIKNEGNGTSTLFNKSGKAIIKQVSYIQRINANYYAVSQNIKDIQGNITGNYLPYYLNIPTAIFDDKGKRLTDYIYYNVGELGNGEISVTQNNQTYLLDENLNVIKQFKKLRGYWALTMSNNLIKAVLGNNIRYYTKQGQLVFQSDGTFALNNGAKLVCELYTPKMYVNVTYPQISSLTDINIQNTINKELYDNFINRDVKQVVSGTLSAYNSNFTFNQISNILHIQASGSEGSIGTTTAAPKQIKSDYYFDLSTGKEYTLSDLFLKDSNYKSFIEKTMNHKIYVNGVLTNLTFDDLTSVVIYKDKIQVYYVIYSLMGTEPFICNISYNQLNNYIDKSSDLWKNISVWKS